MVHPLVDQLRFTRDEFRRGLAGMAEEDAQAHLGSSNCISWSVGHLAWQEQRYFVTFGQGETILPQLPSRFGYGSPPSTPTLAEAWAIWERVTLATDRWLETLTADDLRILAPHDGRKDAPLAGSLLRTTYHYWFHNGENAALRQQLGHTSLPTFVGELDGKASYRPA
ncbi:MAG: hypothetical protein AVDCRST_MAG87-402 [uncultured Thermomicrobiales bacterium]|uniref:DinB-like domain-containing protein n=1 Tax=uncultured Thermomicrobiales bacterium TaxID=1645740 RepID=A0A6J4UAP0_9BACT|nr:MAG: hypothetical protein AVDCRST_MAG87-402 [uncultured Thermomicrobiales bacterium]